MKFTTYPIRNGYDGQKCFVHARCCFAPDVAIATAQYLDVTGCDLFSGIYMSKSYDEGKTWSDFVPQEGLMPTEENGVIIGNCDGTPIYHEKTGKVLLIGHKVQYNVGGKEPGDYLPATFYSVYDAAKDCFGPRKFIELPEGIVASGSGSAQYIELEDGNLLIPVTARKEDKSGYLAGVLKCSFDGETITYMDMGNLLTIDVARGLCEPSIIYHNDTYYMTIRNDEAAFVARSDDGIHYYDMHFWSWEDGSLLQSYNTQQHWLKLEDELYLVYTRRDETNNRVIRHRAPLWIAKVEDMHLIKSTETALTPQRGARLGNFGCTNTRDGKGIVMAAEWMQPIGCEKYGSDNTIYVSVVEK